MNFFNGIFRSKSSSMDPSVCTPCCPFDTNGFPHPRFSPHNPTSIDSCCLSRMRVNCRIRYPKKKRKVFKTSRQSSIRSSPSSNRSFSLSSALSSPNPSTNTNYYRHDESFSSSSSSSSDDDDDERTRKISSST